MKLPKSWKDITIKQFVLSRAILLNNDLDVIDKHVQLICALTDMRSEYVEQMTPDDFKTVISELSFLNNLESIDTRIPKVFRLKNKLFWTQVQANKITAGQYADINHILSGNDPLDKCDRLLAIICNPRKHGFFNQAYDGRTMEARAEFFYNNLTMNIAYPIALFFCSLSTHLTSLIENYCSQKPAMTE